MKTVIKKIWFILELTPSKTIYHHAGNFESKKEAENIISCMPPGDYIALEGIRILEEKK